MMNLSRILFCLFATLATCLSHADVYPSRPIKIIVAFGPGSGGDILARLLAQYLQPELSTPVIVENKVGALGQIATTALARAPADGYTLGMGSSSTHSSAAYLTKTLSYDTVKDFSAVGRINNYTFVLLVPADSKARTPTELVSELQARGKSFYGYGNASGRVGAAHFKRLANLDASDIAYKSAPDAITDLAGGRVHFLFTDWGSARPFVESGRVRAIGVMADERSQVLPDLPAVGEAYAGFKFVNWGGLLAPAGTPFDAISKLNAALLKVLAKPEVRQRMNAMGLEVKPGSPKELTDLIMEQQLAWGAAIRDAGIKPE